MKQTFNVEHWRAQQRLRIDEGMVKLLMHNVTILPKDRNADESMYAVRIPRAISHRITDGFLKFFGGASVTVSENKEAIICKELAKGSLRDMALSLATDE